MPFSTRLAFAFLSLLLIGTSVTHAQDVFPVHEITFAPKQPIFARKASNPETYILLGSGYIRSLSAKNEVEFIKHWLGSHPRAKVTPISRCNVRRVGLTPEWTTYIWVEDGADCLNVALIEEGIFPGGVMLDMVESQNRLLEQLRDPKLTDVRKDIEKEIAATPESDRPKRLVSDAEYAIRRNRIEAAETKAREAKKGIWSDGMKAERQAEGLE